MIHHLRHSGLLLLSLAGGCRWLTEPVLPAGSIAFTPPAAYEKWWSLTESCSGRTGDVNAIRWYVVPNATSVPAREGPSAAAWFPDGNAIVFAQGNQFDGELVRHEMLHALLREPGHDRTAFITRCRGVVVCVKRCVEDGGPPPPSNPGAVPVRPDTIVVSVEVAPVAPSSASDGAYYMMMVTARNPLDQAVEVQLPPSGDAGAPVSFSYHLASGSGGLWADMRADVPEDWRFAPGEAKRYIFDFRIGPCCLRYQIPPDSYVFGGAYGGAWAANPPSVTIAP